MAPHSTLLLALLGLGLAASDAGARCLRYEPSPVVLAGRVEARMLPGPPNYASVARGDRPETVYFLILREAICVSGDPSSRLNARSHAGVEEVQLVVPAATARTAVGRTVRATGTLSGAHTGHHRTPVLLNVGTLRPS